MAELYHITNTPVGSSLEVGRADKKRESPYLALLERGTTCCCLRHRPGGAAAVRAVWEVLARRSTSLGYKGRVVRGAGAWAGGKPLSRRGGNPSGGQLPRKCVNET